MMTSLSRNHHRGSRVGSRACKSLFALGALLFATGTGCASKAPPPAYAPPPYAPPAAQPQQPPPPSPMPGVASAAMDALTALQGALPCPLPGLPPEVARFIDCAALREASNAVAYVPRVLTASALPGQVDLRTMGLTGPVKNQDPVGACAGFAVSTVLDNHARRKGRTDVISPLHVFSTYTQQHDLGQLKGRGMTTEPVWPFDKVKACRIAAPDHGGYCQSEVGVVPGSGAGDPVLLAEKANADAWGRYRVDAFEKMTAKDIDQMALLLSEGEAVWVALRFDREAWRHSSVKGGYLPPYPPVDGLGHAVVLIGYRSTAFGREFLFQNSWGTDWGLGGYLWITEAMMRTHVMHAYRIRSSDASGPPSVPPSMPSVPSTPAAGACPAGSASILGVCVPSALPIPSVQPPVTTPAACPAGTLPNPLSPGQCVQIPAGFPVQ